MHKQWAEVPTVGTYSGNQKIEETMTLVGPMRLEESLHIRDNRISIPVTISGIHSHSKIGDENVMYNLPMSGDDNQGPKIQV